MVGKELVELGATLVKGDDAAGAVCGANEDRWNEDMDVGYPGVVGITRCLRGYRNGVLEGYNLRSRLALYSGYNRSHSLRRIISRTGSPQADGKVDVDTFFILLMVTVLMVAMWKRRRLMHRDAARIATPKFEEMSHRTGAHTGRSWTGLGMPGASR